MRQPYPSYKDSGVDRIGDIPSHWLAVPLKRRFSVVGGSTPKSDDESFWEGDITWVTPADLSGRSSLFIEESGRTITETGLTSCGTTLVPPNSIVLSTRAPIGSLAVATIPLCTNQGCRALVPQGEVDSVYIAYVLTLSTEALNVRGRGTTFLELSGDELGAFVVPAPPYEEQRAITAFLDRETGKIDALVEEQRRLIALLKEKRQAVISHAVTKGLNPDAPLKPSGIDWLGDIPEHWELVQLRRIVSQIFNGLTANQVDPGAATVPVTRIESISRGVIDYERVGYIHESDAREDHRIHEGDICFSNINSLRRIGNCARYEGGTRIYAGMNVLIIRPDMAVQSHWFFDLMRSSQFRLEVESRAKPAINQASISQSSLLSIAVPVPPRREQASIVEYIATQIEKVDALISEAETAIDLLQERRSALISAAVTGKVDVRGEAVEEQREQSLEAIEASVGT